MKPAARSPRRASERIGGLAGPFDSSPGRLLELLDDFEVAFGPHELREPSRRVAVRTAHVRTRGWEVRRAGFPLFSAFGTQQTDERFDHIRRRVPAFNKACRRFENISPNRPVMPIFLSGKTIESKKRVSEQDVALTRLEEFLVPVSDGDLAHVRDVANLVLRDAFVRQERRGVDGGGGEAYG